MNTKSLLFLLVFILACGFFAAAENSEAESGSSNTSVTPTSNTKKDPLERIHIGGNLSGGITNDFYFITAAPRLSYDVTKWLVPGVTVVYMYSQQTDPSKVTTNTYGAGIFTDIYPIKYVFAHAEYQHLWYNQKVKGIESGAYTFDDNFLLLGAGVKVPIDVKASVFASVLFNVLNNERSERYMYKNPIFSLGIDVNL